MSIKVNPKSRLFITLSLIVCLVIGIVVLFYFEKSKDTSTSDKVATKNDTTQSQANKSIALKLSKNENGYINKEHGFSIKYPENWMEEDKEPEILVIISPKEEVISVGTVLNPEQLDFQTWFEKYYEKDFRASFISTTISGNKAYASDKMQAVYIYLPNKNVLTVTYTQCEAIHCLPGHLDVETFHRILSTLQFAH